MITEETALRFVTTSGRPFMLSEQEIFSILVRLSWDVPNEPPLCRGGQGAGNAGGRGTGPGDGSQHQGGGTLFVDQWNPRDVEAS